MSLIESFNLKKPNESLVFLIRLIIVFTGFIVKNLVVYSVIFVSLFYMLHCILYSLISMLIVPNICFKY